jgi:glycosyltransferase involved in cell wall biosynthesis
MTTVPAVQAPARSDLSPSIRRDFAVLVPAYNEADNMPELVSELRAMFDRFGLSGEVIIIDDGSSDGTAERALECAGGWDRLRVVSHRRNFGKTEAMVTGARATDATWLVLFDADLQHSVDEIPRFLRKLDDGWDIVTGRKIGTYEKRVVSSIYNRLSRAIFRLPVSDINSMKAFRREVIDEVRLRHDWHRFFVVLAFARGFKVTEIDIELLPRRHGTAKYSGRGRILVGLLDLASVTFVLFYARKPLIVFGFTGLVLAATGAVLGITTIVLRVLQVMPPFGFRPLLYLVILLEVLGFLLFGFGFVGELVAQLRTDVEAIERRVEGIEKRLDGASGAGRTGSAGGTRGAAPHGADGTDGG